jgi:dephospho-CoA kinase
MRAESIVILGKHCAGKTTLGRFLRQQYGFSHVEASKIIQRKLARLDGDSGLENLLDLYGRDMVSQSILNRFGPDPGRLLVVTGIRLQEELDTLVSSYDPLIIWIEAAQLIRCQRYLSRQRSGVKRTAEDFMAREETEEKLLSVSASDAHAVLQNDSSLAQLFEQVEAVLDPPPNKRKSSTWTGASR